MPDAILKAALIGTQGVTLHSSDNCVFIEIKETIGNTEKVYLIRQDTLLEYLKSITT